MLRLIAEGRSNGEIADELFVSLKTIEHHVSSILANWGSPDDPTPSVPID